jgi:cytosine/adenosine deaminase-related metal-dependent hydrolase
MIRYQADWLLPISASPIHHGWVSVAAGRIRGVGARDGSGSAPGAIDLGRVAILPALVNVHTHLELSYLHGRVPAGTTFTQWVRTLMALRRQYPDPSATEILSAARDAIAAARASGTGLLGDISNTLVTVPLLRDAAMAAQVFHELLGFNVADPAARVAAAAAAALEAGNPASAFAQGASADKEAGHHDVRSPANRNVRVTLAAHAPYSVSPAMFRAIRAAVDQQPAPLTCVHLGESAEEVEFLKRGTGSFRALLEELGVWAADWEAPGNSPVGYLSDLGFLDRCALVVHGVQFDGDDLSRLKSLGTTVASCPRSNVHVGVGSPPLEAFYAMGVGVAFGTDSLASVADLNLFSELKEARRIAPRVPARRLLESATLIGARALGFGDDFGCIDAGRRALLIAVSIPAGVDDVEEYLVSGIEPHEVTWLDAETPNSQFPTPKQ